MSSKAELFTVVNRTKIGMSRPAGMQNNVSRDLVGIRARTCVSVRWVDGRTILRNVQGQRAQPVAYPVHGPLNVKRHYEEPEAVVLPG